MTDIRFIAKQYIDAGWAVVPLVKGEKKAATSWQRKTYKPSDFNLDDGIAGKCGEPSGWRVDVDLDCPEAIVAARKLLPPTGLIHGRPSKLSSHYWFFAEGMKTTQFTDVKDSAGVNNMLVEIRSSGGYTVLPPSGHPSGEFLSWEHERLPTVIAPDQLYRLGSYIAIASIVARHWPGSGVRHQMVGNLTGFLLQAELPPELAVLIVEMAATAAGDQDPEDRLKFARNTAAKFADGSGKVTGGPRLAEDLGQDVVNKLRAWLKLKDLDALEQMNARHFVVRMGKDTVIGREDDDEPVFQQPKALYTEYANKSVQVGADEDSGEPNFKPLFPTWLEYGQRRAYRKVCFDPPPFTPNPLDYNLWRGLMVEPADDLGVGCARFLEHMHEVICSGNTAHYEYLTKWCARLLQAPGLAGQVAIALRGQRGTGKGMFAEGMFSRIFGHRNFIQIDKVDHLVGHFNAALSGKVLVFADESFWAGDKREVGALKRLITEPTLSIERKGIDVQAERNCVHLVMATNEDWAIPAGEHERRFFAVEVSPLRRQDLKYFARLKQELDSTGPASFLAEMLKVPWSETDIRTVPVTKELRVQQNMTLPPEKQWWRECLNDAHFSTGGTGGTLVWQEWVPVTGVYAAYEAWGRSRGVRLLDKFEFGRRMHDLMSDRPKSVARRMGSDVVKCWHIRPLGEARKIFDDLFGGESEWDDAPSTSGTIPF